MRSLAGRFHFLRHGCPTGHAFFQQGLNLKVFLSGGLDAQWVAGGSFQQAGQGSQAGLQGVNFSFQRIQLLFAAALLIFAQPGLWG